MSHTEDTPMDAQVTSDGASHDEIWKRTREASSKGAAEEIDVPSAGPMKSPNDAAAVQSTSDAHTSNVQDRSATRANRAIPRPAPLSQRSRTGSTLSINDDDDRSTPSTPAPFDKNPLMVDAEDEDVKIAIMALGAMKHLDGSASSSASGSEGPSRRESSADKLGSSAERGPAGQPTDAHLRVASLPSTSSAASTMLSSPMSTPGSEMTGLSMPSSASSSKRTAGSQFPATPRTLGDLPADFPFPAVVTDEHGNELTVDPEMMKDADFLRRVSHLPIVRGTLRAYELSKQRSRVVKYGGDLVESGVKAIGGPVVSRLGARLGEKNVEQLDAFASRQLERLYPTGEDPASREENQQILEELDERERTEWKDMGAEEKSKRRRAYWALRLEEREREMVVNELRQRKGKSRAQDSESNESGDRNGWATGSAPASQAIVATRSSDGFDGRGRSDSDTRAIGPSASTSGSGWGSMLVEAGVTAGGLSAAVSEESMKSLKYCLQWLQYATAHIEHQITILRDLIVKLNHGELELSNAALQSLGLIKGDVVGTIRGVVDVVGKYAGGALPEPARRSVKAFILSLPARWATVNRVGGPVAVGNGAMGSPTGGSFGGSPASPSFSAAHISGGDAAMQHQLRTTSPHRATQAAAARQQQQMQQVATQQAANRILTLAVESLDVLRSVTIIFGESLDRADLWVERLRVLGLQRKRAHEHALAEEAAARIDVGMGGALTSGRHADWESARGMSGLRGASPGADSVASMTTSASGSKRRRTRGDPTSTKSPSPSMRGASDDEGQRTETDSRSAREGAMRNRSRSRSRSGAAATLPAFTPGASGASSSAIASPNHHSSGAHSASQRRKRGSARHYSARTPSANNTPAFAFKELDLHGGGAAKRG